MATGNSSAPQRQRVPRPVQARREKEIDFAEIVQRPGKPTFAIIRGVRPSDVAKIEMLPADLHADLAERFREYRYKALIEAGRMEEVKLTPVSQAGQAYLSYQGSEFNLL